MSNTWFEGKTALITDASTGLGQAWASALARRGTHLMLVVREAASLSALAATLSRLHAVSVEVIAVDVCQEGAAQLICAAVERMGRRVDILVNNAGSGLRGRLETLSEAREHALLRLNIVTLVDLTQRFLPPMLARGRGAIVNVTSTVVFEALPSRALYGAAEAFIQAFSRTLWAETRQRGVRVLALCPGGARTGIFGTIGPHLVVPRKLATAESMVAKALRALERQQNSVMSDAFNALLARFEGRPMPLDLIGRLRSEPSVHPARGEHRSWEANLSPRLIARPVGDPCCLCCWSGRSLPDNRGNPGNGLPTTSA